MVSIYDHVVSMTARPELLTSLADSVARPTTSAELNRADGRVCERADGRSYERTSCRTGIRLDGQSASRIGDGGSGCGVGCWGVTDGRAILETGVHIGGHADG